VTGTFFARFADNARVEATFRRRRVQVASDSPKNSAASLHRAYRWPGIHTFSNFRPRSFGPDMSESVIFLLTWCKAFDRMRAW